MALLCQTGPSRSVPVPISLATPSLLFLARGAPALVGLMYRGPTALTAPLEQGERPQIFCSAPRKLSEAKRRPPHPQQLLHRGVSTARTRDPGSCRDCWPHTETEAFASVPRAANGEHRKAFLQRPLPSLPGLHRPCLFWNNDCGLRQSRSEKCMGAPTRAGRQAANNQITQFRARPSC